MGRKKEFNRDAIEDVPGVAYERREDGDIEILPSAFPPSSTAIHFHFENNPSVKSSFEFKQWYGVGIDEITYVFQRQIERVLSTGDGNLSTATIKNYFEMGSKHFLNYCCLMSHALNRPMSLADIDRDLIDGYLTHLKQSELGASSQKKAYDNTKAVLSALGRRGIVSIATSPEPTFPRNPFPNSAKNSRGEKPLSTRERKALIGALKTGIMPLLNEDKEPTGELLTLATLVIALRTGRNTTPLLEMTTDCLRPHPKAGMKLLVVYKRRGNNTHKVPLRSVKDVQEAASALPDVVRIIERITELTARLRPEAPAFLRDRLLLYRSRRRGREAMTVLKAEAMQKTIKKLVSDADLTDANNKPLRLNISRLRKTFINRIFEILDRDLLATARAAGNTPQVSDRDYLAPGENAEKDWRFMGNMLVAELKNGALHADATPSGQCTDNKNGQFAPKNGASCTDFMSCFRCRNYVVTGDDLYRVFSFYWLIVRERLKIGSRKWNKHYAHLIRLIDRDIIQAGVARKVFSQAHADAMRRKAKMAPHPFWANSDVLETTT